MYLSKVCRNVSTKWWHIVILRWAHMVLHSISTFINVWSKKKSFIIIWGCVNYGRILDVKKSRQACEEVILFGLWSGEQLSSMCCWWSNRSSCELWVCDMEVNRCTQRDHGNCWEKRGVCCATRNRECLFKESWSGTCPSRRDSTTYGQTISGHFRDHQNLWFYCSIVNVGAKVRFRKSRWYLDLPTSIYLSIYPSIHLSIYPSVRPSIHPSIHPSSIHHHLDIYKYECILTHSYTYTLMVYCYRLNILNK